MRGFTWVARVGLLDGIRRKSADRCDREAFGRYFWGLINEGVYMPCSQFEALFFSRLHTEAMIDETIDAAAKVLKAIA